MALGLQEKAEGLLANCRAKGLKIATAESCTGGLIAATLTEVPGSSDVVERGFITYSNEAKAEILDVPPETIRRHGAVSEEVARAMAEGALKASKADIVVAVTGIAGPTGGSTEKPVGLVHLAAARRGGRMVHRAEIFPGDRQAVRLASVRVALDLMSALL